MAYTFDCARLCSRVLAYSDKNWTAGLSFTVNLYVLITLTSCYFYGMIQTTTQ